MEQKKSVGIWIRVSTEDQAKGESPEHHEKRARYYAESKGWDVKVVYHLEAVSGKSVMQHPEAKKMLRDIKDGVITGLIFSKLARLARNTRELLDFADLFNNSKADLISLQEAIDTSTPAGRLFYTMIAAMAQWEREEIASRVAASVPIRAKLGKPLGGQGSFGYIWQDRNLVLNEKEAPIRKLLYELFLKHRRKKTTARALNEMGYRTRNGSKFSDTTVDRLIRDPNAKGEHRSNYTKSLGDGKQWQLKPKTDWVINPCPPLVSEAVWDECNLILDDQLKKRKHPGRKAVHLLSGFLYCTCGKKMYIYHEGQNENFVCKTCKTRIAAADIDEIYHEQLKTFLLTETDVQTHVQKSDAAIAEKETLLKNMNDEANKVKKRMDDLVQMRLNSELSRDAFVGHHKPLEERLSQINDQIPEIEAEIDFLRIQYLSADTILREAKDLYERWPTIPFEEKRGIVEVITNRVTIGKEDIAIKLSYLPSVSPKSAENGNTSLLVRDLAFAYKIRLSTGEKMPWLKTFQTVIMWEFGAAITPKIGEVAFILFVLKRSGLSYGRSMAVILLNTFLDNLCFVVVFPLLYWCVGPNMFAISTNCPDLANHVVMQAVRGFASKAWYGYSFFVLVTVFFGIALFVLPHTTRKFFHALSHIKLLSRIKNGIKHFGDEIEITAHEYRHCGTAFYVKMVLATLINWTGRYMLVVAIIFAFNPDGFNALDVFARQYVLWIFLVIPSTPGQSGVAEIAFIALNCEFMPVGLSAAIALIWRMYSYYIYLVLGMFILPRWAADSPNAKAGLRSL